MTSWEFLQGSFHNPLYINFLFFLKSFPVLLGSLVSNVLFNHISHIYDVVLTYIEAHEIMEQEVKKFQHLASKVRRFVLAESEENKKCGEEYIKHYLSVSFPEIQGQLQNKKAAFTILEAQVKILNERLQSGQIDQKEHEQIVRHVIQRKVALIDDLRPDWKAPSPQLFLKNIPLFDKIPPVILESILQDAQEMIFERDQYITKEGETAKFLFVVLRGQCTESCVQQQEVQ